MFKVQIDTDIHIGAPPSRVWEVLSDLASYEEWNPMIRSAAGTLAAGEKLDLHFEPAGQKGHDFRPKLLVAEPGRELRWLGIPRFPGLFDSQHYFILEEQPGGKTHLRHGMSFYGLLIPLAGKRLDATTRGPFDRMNAALKERAESRHTR